MEGVSDWGFGVTMGSQYLKGIDVKWGVVA